MQTSNLVYAHPTQPEMQVEIILASTAKDCPPIWTVRFRYPRPIHGEIMTHRRFGRNARSSRAVPVKTMLNEVRSIPYVPWHWGKNQRGMQADEECNTPIYMMDWENQQMELSREEAWLHARDVAADMAEAFMNSGYHKQNPNRLLEPFSWMDTLITTTDFDNFLWLRDHKDAEPHLQDLARLLKQALDNCVYQNLEPGEWHLPYVTPTDIQNVLVRPSVEDEAMFDATGLTGDELLRCISAARCARISYKPFDGDPSYERELERYNMLVTSDRVHASPLEHQAKPDSLFTVSTSTLIRDEVVGGSETRWREPQLHGNLEGWIQARKLIPNEVYSSN